ncbi:MAG: 7-cyano-7-deazaguanine synthase QueC, partial [Elusimicrobiota bacterium]|nr:7-cyano-7-deazaguanine synthase QueC [Elusimicrobiota bacterium]
MNNETKKAVVLLSGGMDSAVTLLLARQADYKIYALTFDYGQKSRFEIESAKKIANEYGIAEHVILKLDLAKFGGSSLTDRAMDVPSGETSGVPSTYVPARNLIMLSVAVSWAEVLGTSAVFIGVNVRDYSGYPDCRKSFLDSFEETAGLATKKETKIAVQAPLILMSKAKIAETGRDLGLDFSITSSCYNPAE